MRSRFPLFPAASTSRVFLPKYLVEPTNRFTFALLFMLATAISWLLVGLALRPLQSPNLPLLLQPNSLLSAFVSGIVAGMMVGALQWLVLRWVAPDWLWIITSIAGYSLSMTGIQAWQGWLQAHGNRFAFLAGLAPSAVSLFSVGLTAICMIWLGLLQWLLLRHYARPSWVWIFVPAIAVIVSSLFVGFYQLLPVQRWLSAAEFSAQVYGLAASLVGWTQAITLCTLRRRTAFPLRLENPLLLEAPEITQTAQVRRLARRLFNQLNRTWEGEVNCERPTSYLVGVTESGAIAAYEPENSLAADYAVHTPLPTLVTPPPVPPKTEVYPSLARLQVTFLPSGSLLVHDLKGVALLDLAWKLLLVSIGFGWLVGFLRLPLILGGS